ncbi:RING finger protein [Endozoicomonas sp. 8E]|uniref:RING finger protein n=1 Tax=Endozoicomonas sp. 8E TaxID=3035692 RepID=UPI00293907E9|nr:RING finger protein [Endozoicomonas sp. 8E]WOG29210.1 RING finger protein [Endozoicomonas sp. 8E]
MAISFALKTLLFSVFLFFYQQGLANDTYRLEKFRHHQIKNWKQLSKEQQRCSGQLGMSPVENIRIGFVRLNLVSDDVSGDERVEICEDYEVDEQDFNRLNNFYFNYVNRGNPQRRKVRIQRILRLIHRIFAININRFNDQSRAEKELVNVMAKSLFDQLFLSDYINGSINLYFHYFYLAPAEQRCNSAGVNNELVLIFLAFLGPHFLTYDELHICFTVLYNRYTVKNHDKAYDRALLSENINEYNSPQSLANQLIAAELDAEIALLIGLTAMATAAIQRMYLGQESQETLETLLIRCLPYELLGTIYTKMSSHCHTRRTRCRLGVMFTEYGMREFTHSIVGIDPTPVLPEASSLESLEFLNQYPSSGSEVSVEESDSEDHDQSIVIQQQNELIAELRQELANQSATEEAGAAGGVTGVTKKCGACLKPLEEMIKFESCEHAGLCQICIERIIREQTGCPYCRLKSESYKRVLDMSSH